MFAGFFALGVMLISRERTFAVDLGSLLVGHILGASWTDLIVMAVLTIVVTVLVLAFLPELRFTAYDPEVASVSGVPVTFMQIGLLVLIALATVVAFRLVGVILAVAMLVTPAAAAVLLTRRLSTMMLMATMVGIVVYRGRAVRLVSSRPGGRAFDRVDRGDPDGCFVHPQPSGLARDDAIV